jgi:hypothetical protein
LSSSHKAPLEKREGKKLRPSPSPNPIVHWNPFKKKYGYLGLRFKLALAQNRLASNFSKDAAPIFTFE